ncbi:MAG TPA: flavodoxin domain-containing protein [Xanthobacteraceae bacterium]
MASHLSQIPKTAPFAQDEIDILNRVVGSASPIQRAWLAGFLAGVDAQVDAHGDAHAAAARPAAAPRAAEPLTIVFASESGNSERLANDLAKIARKRGFRPSVVDMADLDVATLPATRRLVVIAATWGEGEPPARAVASYAALMGDGAPRLDGVEFAVLALGDTAYVEFCAIGKAIDARLEALGAKRVAERADLDLDFAEPAARWIEGAVTALAPPAEPDRGQAATVGQVIAVDFGATAAEPNLGPFEAEVIAHIDLNSSRSAKETIHLELAFDGKSPAYNPGDSLDLYPHNDPAYVEQLLKAAGLAQDGALRDDLTAARDVTTLSLKTVENYASATGQQYVKSLIESGEARNWIAGRQLIDLIEHFPISLSGEQLRGLTRPLAPRAYSIASSRREVGDEAHLLVSAVRYDSHGRSRTGVASGFVADRLRRGDRVRVKVRPNKHFALPAADRDIIMVGPGTGVAPFRSFVQERRAAGATGKSWLFFGDRNYTHDFLYQLEWQDALKDGALTRMDVAFSRDTPEKLYVQNRLWDRRRELVDWLDDGATFYVCGDAKQMAKDVRGTLVRAYADVKAIAPEAAEQAVGALERGRRYLQDVY